MPRAGVSHYNILDEAPFVGGVMDTSAIKAEFARRLQTAMVRLGWNQSELARRATEKLPKPAKGQKRGLTIGRDLVSHYMRGTMLPGPANLVALAAALGVKPSDLMPSGVPMASGEPTPFEMKSQSDGRMYLRINRTVTPETAMKIMAILGEEDRQSS